MSVVLIASDERMLAHDPTPGHPERPARLAAMLEAAAAFPRGVVKRITPAPAPAKTLALLHEPAYVERILSLDGARVHLDPDTAVAPGSVLAARLAAGAAIDLTRLVATGPDRRGVALVRPPGHHAEPDRAMGFCLFNNIAIAAAVACAELGCERGLIVDWDVHHGNGTQHAFETRSDVLFFSTHRTRFYPGTGELDEIGRGSGRGYTVNAPLPVGADDAFVGAVYEQLLTPIADAYRPDLVLVSAGFDAHAHDPLGGLRMTDDGFASLCGLVRDLADRHADGRLVLVVEGGYDTGALRRCITRCIEVLSGAEPPPWPEAEKEAIPAIAAHLDRLRQAHALAWPCLRA